MPAGAPLVRDGIPRIIEADGGQTVTRVLDQAGYLAGLGFRRS
jgi:predicted house-cleaning noncanonical NTP pyrophosphatase (MazG superfamily)